MFIELLEKYGKLIGQLKILHCLSPMLFNLLKVQRLGNMYWYIMDSCSKTGCEV